MKIRRKILLYFSVVTIVLIGVTLFFIYTLFSGYREEEFQQRQKEKITTTLKFLTNIKRIDDELINEMDRLKINDLFDEKLLLFSKEKKLIYSSIDNTPIPFSKNILNRLSSKRPWIETKDELYDVVGVYIEDGDKRYYGISKAYDTFGYSKLNYLKYVLIITFFGISIITILVSYYLSKKITQPIVDITRKIKNFDFDIEYIPLETGQSKNEIDLLAQQFNKLMKKTNDVFSFQKHAIHHISHELKTPIAVLVSNFERIEKEADINTIKVLIQNQKEDTKSLGEIINSLLEIAKVEAGNALMQTYSRIDEMIFDIADELNNLYPDFRFSIEYNQVTKEEKHLLVSANPSLLKSALINLMLNCIHYSNDKKARIVISGKNEMLCIDFRNKGSVINEKEKQFLFQHFFRGENSKGRRGFGLGLVFVHKIIALHGGTVSYTSLKNNSNSFTITLPLS